MSMRRMSYYIFAFLLFSAVSGMSQVRLKEGLEDGKTLVMLTPQYLLIDEIRIEFDRKISGRHWVTLAPHYVQDIERYHAHQGFGLVATYKFLFKNYLTYLGGGAQFTHHIFDNSALDNRSGQDLWLYKAQTTRFGVNMVAGRYVRFFPYLFGDFYAGVGYRFATTTSTDGIPHSFRNNFFKYEGKGLTIVFGARVGLML